MGSGFIQFALFNSFNLGVKEHISTIEERQKVAGLTQ